MSRCCLVSHQAMSVLQGGSLDYARDDNGAKRYQNSAALLIFMRRTTPLNPLNLLNPPNLFRT